jgi:hypothetical protein
MRIETSWISTALAMLVLAFGAAGAGAQAPEAGNFEPMAFLVGSCWKGTFPDGKSADEHCYEWVWGGKFVRDRHVVKSARPDYEGETLFAWDASRKQIVFWYFTNQGFYTTGALEPRDGELVIPETVVGEKTTERKTVIRPNGRDSYTVRSETKEASGWKEQWTMELKRVSRRSLPAELSLTTSPCPAPTL